jgi:hypothetical protein
MPELGASVRPGRCGVAMAMIMVASVYASCNEAMHEISTIDVRSDIRDPHSGSDYPATVAANIRSMLTSKLTSGTEIDLHSWSSETKRAG